MAKKDDDEVSDQSNEEVERVKTLELASKSINTNTPISSVTNKM